ncbi:RNA polymerase sigma factor [Actinoplanes sp. OR16]|uniref:sigma-70 family RNA polymerase sigma factor n=1 Tax=Actinoplanes sp. OR16 TaxID=946334 RepID=UPI000F6E795E|nr:sigma-70 family RNA polymerase sigma factor [Actinoplanes sp. OR16]BBH69114.1 RNA polymerase sigma factor [Actinoplanes sp. OR16]
MSADRLTDLHARYAPELLRYLSGFAGGNRQTAEDLLQETMIRVWRHLDNLPPEPEQTRRWLFTVARNVAIDAIRRRQVRPAEVSLPDALPEAGPDATSGAVVAVDTLKFALGSLSGPHRRILDELYLRGRTPDETARLLGVPIGTVKSRAHYALRSLREAVSCPVS